MITDIIYVLIPLISLGLLATGISITWLQKVKPDNDDKVKSGIGALLIVISIIGFVLGMLIPVRERQFEANKVQVVDYNKGKIVIYETKNEDNDILMENFISHNDYITIDSTTKFNIIYMVNSYGWKITDYKIKIKR